jgi:hypothetical protein
MKSAFMCTRGFLYADVAAAAIVFNKEAMAAAADAEDRGRGWDSRRMRVCRTLLPLLLLPSTVERANET